MIKTLCETLGFTKSKLSKVLKHFVYDGGRPGYLSEKFIICIIWSQYSHWASVSGVPKSKSSLFFQMLFRKLHAQFIFSVEKHMTQIFWNINGCLIFVHKSEKNCVWNVPLVKLVLHRSISNAEKECYHAFNETCCFLSDRIHSQLHKLFEI